MIAYGSIPPHKVWLWVYTYSSNVTKWKTNYRVQVTYFAFLKKFHSCHILLEMTSFRERFICLNSHWKGRFMTLLHRKERLFSLLPDFLSSSLLGYGTLFCPYALGREYSAPCSVCVLQPEPRFLIRGREAELQCVCWEGKVWAVLPHCWKML